MQPPPALALERSVLFLDVDRTLIEITDHPEHAVVPPDLPALLVLELESPSASKGEANRGFMTEPPFAARQPVFIRDDVTDDAGFVAVGAVGGGCAGA